MATCPNKNLDSWKDLVAIRGEDIAYYLWDYYKGEVPQEEYTAEARGAELPTPVKPGVAEIFDSTPELASIGTPEQYSEYLDTIFPDSKVKDIVYHGAMEQLLPKDGKFKGYVTYFTDFKNYAETFGFPINRKVISAVINVKSPFNAQSELADVPEEIHVTDEFTNPRIIKSNTKGYDSVVGIDAGQKEGKTIAVFEPEQIHILGGKQDVEGFRDFVVRGALTSSTLKKPLTLNAIIKTAESFNEKTHKEEAERIASLVLNKLRIKVRNFTTKTLPNVTSKAAYIKSIFPKLLSEVGLSEGITSLQELKTKLENGEAIAYVRQVYNNTKNDLEVLKKAPSAETLKNFLKNPDIENYDEEQQALIRKAFPALFGDLGLYKSYNQALANYKRKMETPAFVEKLFGRSKQSFYNLNSKLRKYETLLNYYTLAPESFNESVYNFISNEVSRREAFFESTPVKEQVEKLLAEEADYKYRNTIKGILERLTGNMNTVSGKIAKLYLSHPKTIASITAEDVVKSNFMFVSGGSWNSKGEISVGYKDETTLRHVLLHELTHHFTVPYMHTFYRKELQDKEWYEKNPERQAQIDEEADEPGRFFFKDLTTDEVENLKKIDAIYRRVVDAYKAGDITFESNVITKTNPEYGLNDAYEFVAEALSNPYFAAKIAELPSMYGKKSNMLKDLLDALFRLLGVKEDTLLDDLYGLFEETFLGKDDKYVFGDNLRATPEIAFQLPTTEMKEASDKTLRKVREFLKRIGVDARKVENIVINGEVVDANAVADFTRQLIEYVDGKEGAALTEEAMHFAVEILEQTNPKLLEKMLKDISKYSIYDSVLKQYSRNPEYMTKEGKPDIRKLKKEAVAKQLANMVVERVEEDSLRDNMEAASWWQQVVNWFKELFTKAGFNPFEEAVTQVLEGEIGTVEDVKAEGIMYQLTPGEVKRDELFKRIKEGKAVLTEDGYKVDGQSVLQRATDMAKKFYDRIFGDKTITKTEHEQAVDDIKADYGTAAHADIKNILDLFIDPATGFRRTEPLEDNNIPQTNKKIYDLLKKHMQKRVMSYPDGTRFLYEFIVNNGLKIGGTIDFMAITKDGKVNLLDWKTMDLNTDKFNDVPWYKKKAWRIQMTQYKKILQEAYGVKSTDFADASMIPIKATYRYEKEPDGKSYPILTGLEIGNVQAKLEEKDYLLPVSLEQQSTGDPQLDKLMRKLYGLRESLEGKVVKTPEERYLKAEQLNLLEKAIRHLQVRQNIKPLIAQAKGYAREVQSLFDFYENVLKEKDFTTIDNRELSDFGIKLNRAFDLLEIYTNLDNELSSLFQGTLDEEQKKLEAEVADVVRESRKLAANLENLSNNFGEKIAESEGYKDLTAPEVQVALNKRLFTETSRLQMKTLQVFYQKRREAQNKMDFQTSEENTELLEKIKPAYDELAKRMGWTLKNYFDILVKKGTNELIDQFKSDFYKIAKERTKVKDYDWIQENIDVEAYKKKLKENYDRDVQYAKDRVYVGTKNEQIRQKKKALEDLKKEYDVSTPESAGWFTHYYTLRGFPKVDKWESDEWKALNAPGMKAAKDFYDWIIKVNSKADEAGYLPDDASKRVFLPFIPKSFTERLVFGGKVTLGEDFMRSITIDESDAGYGEIDKVTNKLVKRIPRYFVTDTGRETSTDLFRNMALYNESVNRYQQLSDLEGIALALGRVERNKASIQASFWGKPKYDVSTDKFDEIDNNDKNADLYDRQIATLIYGQKYVESEQFDQLLGKVGGTFDKINKKLGFNLLPANLSDRQLSMNKSLDTLNQFFQRKTLGLNLLSSVVNSLGGTMNAIINAGKHFTKTDFIKSEMEISSNLLLGEYGKKVMAAIQYFQPFTEDMNRELLKDLSLTNLNDQTLQDVAFYLMKKGENFVQSSIFLSVLRNQVLINGEIINARDYLRSQPEYKTRYSQGVEKLAQIEAAFEGKVEELIKNNGLLDQIELKDGKISIPGIDRQSKDVFKVRNLTRELTKNALGNLTPDQVRGIQQNVYGRSAMVFKNWIPSLVDTRLGELKFNSATQGYEWGRYRTAARYFMVNSLRSTLELMTASRLSADSAAALQKLFEEKERAYYLQTGQRLIISEADREQMTQEFYDLVRRNIKQAGVDAAITLSVLTLFILASIAKPDDDDDDAYTKNLHKFTVRALDKLSDELTFFYNPMSFQQILNGSIFPSLGVFTDIFNVVNHFGKEMYGMTFDEKLEEKNHVLKYVLKPIPLVSQMAAYLPLYAPELAKDLGIEMSTQSRMR